MRSPIIPLSVCALIIAAAAARAQSDFSISQNVPAQIHPGLTLPITVFIGNAGPAAADLTITDTFTGGWSFVSVLASSCRVSTRCSR